MSWFVKFLKCILCVEDEEREASRNSRYEYQRPSSADSYSRTIPVQSTLRSQPNVAKTSTSSEIPNKWHQNSVNSCSTQNRESIQSNSILSRYVADKHSTRATDPCNRVPTVSSQFSHPSSAKPISATKAILPEVLPKPNYVISSSSSDEILQKAKMNQVLNIVSSSLSAEILQEAKTNQVPYKVSQQYSPSNVISASSLRSQASFKPPSVTTNSTPSLVSSQFSQPSTAKPISATKAILPEVLPKPNYVMSSSSSAEILQKAKTNQVLNEVSQQNSPSNVISASSLRSQASFKPPSVTTNSTPSLVSEKSSQSVHKPKDFSFSPSNYNDNKSIGFSFVSDTEKQSPTTKINPRLSTLQQGQSPKPPPLSSKPTLFPIPSSSTSQLKINNYVWVEKSGTTTYEFPADIKRLIQKDIVPEVLKTPLSPATYKDYFHALLYAEDWHLQEWEGFELNNVTLELHDAKIYTRKRKPKSYISAAADRDEKVFVAFDIDKVLANQSSFSRKPERRPFLLSRDSVSVKPTGSTIKPFQGVIYRVVRSSLVLAEFGESFHLQHDREYEYDVKFSFNRVCLKRAHHAITAAQETLYRNFLFPDVAPKRELPSTDLFVNYSRQKYAFAIRHILRLQGSPPYLVEGPISVAWEHLSITAEVIVEAVVQICRNSPSNRVLLCAPLNNTCDVLMRALKKQINESSMFRANAAFREVDGVPVDILPSCLYEEDMDCFACPSLEALKKYKVISSTFMSSFRLRDEGMIAGHFSHIFLVDASSVTEPEAVVPLANFANTNTIVVVTGAPRNRSGWVRSMIARENGLKISYFERLRYSKLYANLDSRVITRLEDKS